MGIAEFDLITRYFTPESYKDNVARGVGDDGAVVQVPEGKELVVVTDTLVSGRHFSVEDDPYDIGHKSLAVNLSDIAAMGAQPCWYTLNLTIPDIDSKWLARFSSALYSVSDHFGLELVGGDTTQGPLSISVQILGLVTIGQALYRNNAKSGDLIYVTGVLGSAALGYHAKQGMITLPERAEEICTSRLNRPWPRVYEALKVKSLVNAAIDISDGLSGDLKHMTSQSNVGAVVNVDALPLIDGFDQFAQCCGKKSLALTFGDDYELCLAVPEKNRKVFEEIFAMEACGSHCVGYFDSSDGVRYTYGNGEEFSLMVNSYQHFQ